MSAPATHSGRQASHLPFLDGLRGLMALWVLVGHALGAAGFWLPPLSHPGSAVDVFMLISGMLMAYYFRIRENREPWESPTTWLNFYIRRFFRIAPAYYLLLLTALIFRHELQRCAYETLTLLPRAPQAHPVHIDAAPGPLTGMDLLTHLTFTFGFFPKYAVTNILPDWSIGLEMQFYLALPFMMLLYRRIGHFFATGLLIAIWAAATHLFSFGPDGPARLLGSFPMATFLPLKLNCFAVGILLAESYHFKQLDTRKSLLAFLLALVLVRLTFDRYAAVTACFAAVMLIYRGEGLPVALRKLFGSVQGIFGSRVSVFLADTSYSIYLFHLLALWPFGAWLSLHPAFRKLPAFDRFALLLGLTVLVAYPVAYLLHTYVEQPGIKLGKRFVRRHKPLARLQYLSPFSATHSTDFPF